MSVIKNCFSNEITTQEIQWKKLLPIIFITFVTFSMGLFNLFVHPSFIVSVFWRFYDTDGNLAMNYEGTRSVIHTLCPTKDKRDLVNLSFKQGSSIAVASVLAASSNVYPSKSRFLHEIDFLIMWERNGQAKASYELFTHCFLDWQLNVSIACEVVGYGRVNGHLTLSHRSGMNKEGRLVCQVDSLKISSKNSSLVVRLVDEHNQLNGKIDLCSLNLSRKVHRIVGCSQPLYNVDQLESQWPGLIRMWSQYYVKYLGFGYISIYDIDGSAEPYLGDLVERGIVKYYKAWAPTDSMRNLSLSGAYYCSETFMENQCIWQSRGHSEWAMLIHAPDNYLNDDFGAPALHTYLNSVKNQLSAIMLGTLVFGHPNITLKKQRHAVDLFERIQIRENNPILMHRFLPLVNPRHVMMLFVHVLLDPFDKVPLGSPGSSLLVNHYVTMFRTRSIHAESNVSIDYHHDSRLYNMTLPYRRLFY